MIARVWHGRVPREKSDAYLKYIEATGLKEYRETPGNLAAFIYRRDEGDVTHFLTVSHWRDVASIKAFAGDDISRAHYYDEDRAFLLEFEPTVEHYELHTAA